MSTFHYTDHTCALAFETSSTQGSVALGRGGQLLEVRPLSVPRQHAAQFLPTVEALCRAHGVSPRDIALVIVSSGPGSFTGLRISVTAARMIALAHAAALVSVPTLSVIAQNALQAMPPLRRVAVILDAKRGKVFAQSFQRIADRYEPLDEPGERDPAAYCADQPTDCAIMGEGVPYHRAAVEAAGRTILSDELFPPRAAVLFDLGVERARTGALTERRALTPLYVRPPEAEEKWALRRRDGQ